MDCGPPGSSVHGTLQAGILELVAIPFSRDAPQPKDWTRLSCTTGKFFTIWATREAQVQNENAQIFENIFQNNEELQGSHSTALSQAQGPPESEGLA